MEKALGPFQDNVAYFAQDDKILKEKLLQFENRETEFCYTGENKDLNLSINKTHHLHSNVDVQKETSHWYSSLNLNNVNVLYIYGVGLGYSFEKMKEWLRKSSEHCIVYFEDDFRILHRLLKTELGSELIRHKQVKLFYLPDPETLATILHSIAMSLIFQQYLVTALTLYEEVKNDRYAFIQVQISNFSEKVRPASEFLNFGRIYYLNAYRNALYLPFDYQGDKLFGAFKGIPAIIVGAGPSLDRNFEVLQQLKDQALIFAGSTALSALAPGRVQPHFGIGVDPNQYQVSRLMMSNAFDIPFFYSHRWRHEAYRLSYGPHLHITTKEYYQTIDWVMKEMGVEEKKIDAGHNVVNYGVSLAYELGCDPIILVGVDQSYLKNQSYATTVTVHPLDDWKNDFFTKSPMDELLVRRDINGETVYTLWKWIYEANWISQFATSHQEVSFINATEGGIGFAGIPNLTLSEVKEKFLSKSYDLTGRIHDEIQKAKMPETVTIERIIELYKQLSHSLRQCDKLCETIHNEFMETAKQLELGKTVEMTLTSESALEAMMQLEEEVAYTKILDVFKVMFFKIFESVFEIPSMNHSDEERREYDINRANMHGKLYGFLRRVIRVNLKLLRLAHLLYHRDWSYYAEHQGEVKRESAENTRYYANGNIYSIFHDNERLHEFFYPNGHTKMQLPYQDGRLDGTARFFYLGEKLQREISFSKGLRQGKERMWDENGLLLLEVEYRDNKLFGVARQWYQNGQLSKEVEYNEDDCTIRQWNSRGVPLGDKHLCKSDYFDLISDQTSILTDSLEGIFLAFNELNSLTEMIKDEDIYKQVEEIKEDIENLKLLSLEINQMTKEQKDVGQETLWKTPMSKQMIDLFLKTATEKMSEDMKQIHYVIKQAMKRIKP